MEAVPQFGAVQDGRVYADRPAAFGLALREGLIAVVRVQPIGFDTPWIDLPGGGIDPGETADVAVVREFGEETGLKVSAGRAFARADQLFINTDGVAFNNRSTLFAVRIQAEAPHLKVEADHELLWLDPNEAIARLRHDSHAWAVAAWLRRVA
ncbi:NUDIX domain-containing protein [Phenylobacterium sp.]|uniref:NUDIX domain-containing protein n=1 Tax=Phenylobacterium sp. TaxID=1871053 RepID=UPI0035B15B38